MKKITEGQSKVNRKRVESCERRGTGIRIKKIRKIKNKERRKRKDWKRC